jgi:hypothetical protein
MAEAPLARERGCYYVGNGSCSLDVMPHLDPHAEDELEWRRFRTIVLIVALFAVLASFVLGRWF